MKGRTRIVVTLGPATDRPGVLEKLLQNEVDVARINFSHGTAKEHLARIQLFRRASQSSGLNTAVLADLPGPKLRALLAAPLQLKPGQTLTLARTGMGLADVRLAEPETLACVKPGQRVLFDDGRLQAVVAGLFADQVILTIEIGGTLLPNKGINLPDTEMTIPALTSRDREALAVAAEAGVDWLALSFVREAAAAQELRAAARAIGIQVPVLAKIERPEAVHKASEIIKAFDGIMVARGDLGVEIPLEQVPNVQKRLISLARASGKPVVTATDMLDSMRHNPRPTRAEASDVANAVYDGTDAVMLSGETAIGDYPVEAVCCMDQILREAEAHQPEDKPLIHPTAKWHLTDHITQHTCALARESDASAIIVPTLTGRTARLVARHRQKPAIVAVSTNAAALRQLAIVWGVQTVLRVAPIHTGEDRLASSVAAAFGSGAVREGDRVVVLANHPIEGGPGIPTIRIVRVGPSGESHEP